MARARRDTGESSTIFTGAARVSNSTTARIYQLNAFHRADAASFERSVGLSNLSHGQELGDIKYRMASPTTLFLMAAGWA